MADYNYLSLVNDVNKRLNEVKLTADNFDSAVGYYEDVKNAVNAAIRDINYDQFQWPFNHVVQEEALVANTTRYSFPNDTKSVDMDTFRIKYDETLGNGTTKLNVLSYEEYLEKYVDQEYNTTNANLGAPIMVFRTPNLQYGVYPLPDQAYNIIYEYYRLPVDLEAYDDVPTVPESFKHVINEGAMYYAYMFRGDLDAASLSLQKFTKGLKSMRTIFINRYEYVRSYMVNR